MEQSRTIIRVVEPRSPIVVDLRSPGPVGGRASLARAWFGLLVVNMLVLRGPVERVQAAGA
eukprot:6178877-Pleurochrysis_carterae.AAC.8